MVSTVHRCNGRGFLFRVLCACVICSRFATAFPQAVVPRNASIGAVPTPVTVTSQASKAHFPLKVHVERTQTDLGDLPFGTDTNEVFTFGTVNSLPQQSTINEPMMTDDPFATPAVIPFIPGIQSTAEELNPPPGATTDPDYPGGHNEITEPNLTATVPCRGCSPVIEITVSGLDLPMGTTPAAEQAGSTPTLAPATVTAGDETLIINKATAGSSFVIGSTTVALGETVTVDNTPIAVQTTNGQTQVVIGTSTMPLVANPPDSAQSQITEAPIPEPITIGGHIYSANQASQYIIGTQILAPGGAPITISGTQISLAPSASALIINGVTSSIAQGPAVTVFTTSAPPLLTLNGKTYTADAQTRYVLGPGTTLTPGGQVTVSGTVISLAKSETAIVIAGSTSSLKPAMTVVTLTTGGLGGSTKGTVTLMSGSGVQSAKSTRSSAGAGRSRGMGVGRGSAEWVEGWVVPFLVGCAAWVGGLAIWL